MLHMLLWCAEQRRGVAKLGALIIKFHDKKCPFWPQKCVPFLDPRFNTIHCIAIYCDILLSLYLP